MGIQFTKSNTGSFNNPVGWAFENAASRLELLRGFQHPRSSLSGVRV